MTTSPTTTAAELCRQYFRHVEEQDVEAIVSLLAPEGVSEFPFAPEGVQRLYVGPDDVKPFLQLVLVRLLESVRVADLEIFEVSADLVFAELTSDCTTRKGLAYRNRYIVKVATEDGRITLWREYFDPRATDTVK
jgi:ketosteroid isomerase-like protein